MDDSQIRETTLDNGLRVVTERVPYAHSVAFGLRVDAGSRDEPEAHAGISHVLEHMVFKGTARRTARQIAEELDAVGGHMDAFTSKEYTGYSARVLPEHVPLALDVLADMLRNSLIEPAELELEKRVILEEYKSLEDTPEDFVHDLFHRTLWPTHPLGRAVIGTPEAVGRLTREDLLEHLSIHYVPARLIYGASGNLDHDAMVAVLERHFGDLTGTPPPRVLTPPDTTLTSALVSRPTEQAHFCLGTAGVDEQSPDRWALRVLNLIVGGGMSSRLFQEVREKRGLCYSIGTDSISYREGGIFLVFADTSPEHLEEVADLSRKELRAVAAEGVTIGELERAKQQVRAALLLSLDDVGNRMNRLVRSLMFQGRIMSLQELSDIVEGITMEDCARVAAAVFQSEQLAFAAIGPLKRRRRRRVAATAGA